MSEIVEKTLLNARSYILSDKKEVKSEEQVKKYEAITDNIQKEVMLFLSKVMEGSLTEEQTIQLNNLIRISDELESIADYCDSLVQYRKRLFDNQHKFNEASFTELTKIFDGVFDHYKLCVMGLDDFSQLDIEACIDQERELGVMADEIRDAHLQRIQEGIYQPLTGLTFSDMMVALRRIKNHSVNIAQSLAGGKALL